MYAKVNYRGETYQINTEDKTSDIKNKTDIEEFKILLAKVFEIEFFVLFFFTVFSTFGLLQIL